MIDERLQPDFMLSEFLFSEKATRRAIDNTPSLAHLNAIRRVLAPGMQRVRNCLGSPIFISSGYRGPAVNAAVGGSRTSQHMQGLAADFICPRFGGARSIAQYLMERSGEISFDQMIHEGQWVHISFTPTSPRSEVLTAHFTGSGTTYTRGLA